jgi:8-oxo-dGTP diphosphatase
MEGNKMKRYVVGFLFSPDLSKVVLIKKNRPDWQKGLLNGVGGKIEDNESSGHAMSREFFEEAGVFIPISHWVEVLTLKFEYCIIDVYACNHNGYIEEVKTTTDEEIILRTANNISSSGEIFYFNTKYIKNIPSLIDLSMLKLLDYGDMKGR